MATRQIVRAAVTLVAGVLVVLGLAAAAVATQTGAGHAVTAAAYNYDRSTNNAQPSTRTTSWNLAGLAQPGSLTPGLPPPSTHTAPSAVAAEGGGTGWWVGDDVYAATKAGNSPAWSTVRGRFWKNTAADPKLAGQWDEANLARMQSGRAPQRFNPDKGGMEPMELSHEPVPFRDGGTEFVPRWPQDHAAVDPYRRPGY